ncbi:MAG: RNA polymerase sigma-I factor [Tissierellia bacterium]|nr:RNA polymerase sigma-I factor [Tissierellia bacterium]
MENAIVKLIDEAKGNSLKADALIRDYLPFIKSEASKATGRFITDSCDELSIAMIGFHEAIESYSSSRGAFLNYASIVMKRRIIDYYRSEKRHDNQISLDNSAYDDDTSLLDTIEDSNDEYEKIIGRDATRQEIVELSEQLNEFNLSLTDIADNSPKQDRTVKACWKVLNYVRKNREVMDSIISTMKLPITKLVSETGVEKKTIERHRKYLMAIIIVFSNGYEIIRGHLKQVEYIEKVGDRV